MNSQKVPSVSCGNKFDINQNTHRISETDKKSLEEKWGCIMILVPKLTIILNSHSFILPENFQGIMTWYFTSHDPVPPVVSTI